ncbi:MAG: 16S rRNA (uracil(1498)-N(3))-methyltransferase [Archangiaceae bacterium]|nr:16S rRNA (uracil(1498)-N(3))-methyltransferase [Archangiaceae bacterium]
MIRLLHPEAREGVLTVDGAAAHYLFTVHRLRPGDALEVFDGRGQSFRARVTGDNQLTLTEPSTAPKVREVHLLQGMPKADKLELVVQKASELWATSVTPVFCERSVVKSSDSDAKKAQRWQKISDEAARQCGRSEVMKVNPAVSLAQALAPHPTVLVLDENETERTLSSAVRELAQGLPFAVLIGPEGGLGPAERKLLAERGATRVTLGRLVLRTETAALAALSVVRHLDGLLG